MPKKGPASANNAFSALRAFLQSHEVQNAEPGRILMRQGERSGGAFLLESGSVLVYAETSYGEVPLATLSAPRLFGEIGVFADLPRTASVKVLEAAAILPVGKETLLEFGRQSPDLLFAVIGQLGRQIENINKAIGLYTNALAALEKREFDSRILTDLKNPTPELEEFAATFRRFADQILDKRRQHDEMASAALIQQSLLPDPSILSPLGTLIDLHAGMRPARQVGGDFYDYFMLDEDRLAIAVGDVCGKGIPASLFMATVVTVLRTVAREEKNVAAAMARANTLLCAGNVSSMFATMLYGVLHVSTGVLEYCNCGHDKPLVIDGRGVIRRLEGTGVPLALFPERAPNVFSTVLRPDETLLIFTDGVTEAANQSGQEFGETRLLEVIAASDHSTAGNLVASFFQR